LIGQSLDFDWSKFKQNKEIQIYTSTHHDLLIC